MPKWCSTTAPVVSCVRWRQTTSTRCVAKLRSSLCRLDLCSAFMCAQDGVRCVGRHRFRSHSSAFDFRRTTSGARALCVRVSRPMCCKHASVARDRRRHRRSVQRDDGQRLSLRHDAFESRRAGRHHWSSRFFFLFCFSFIYYFRIHNVCCFCFLQGDICVVSQQSLRRLFVQTQCWRSLLLNRSLLDVATLISSLAVLVVAFFVVFFATLNVHLAAQHRHGAAFEPHATGARPRAVVAVAAQREQQPPAAR